MTAGKRHVVVCDDEPDLRETVGEYLEKRGYRVTLAENGAALYQVLEEDAAVDAVVLDINMPGEDGLSVLRRLRSGRPIPVVMLSARGEVVDRIVGLELGADDYLAKPVDLRELEARIKAVLRRAEAPPAGPGEGAATQRKLTVAGLTLDPAGTRLMKADGSAIALTAMEFQLLRVLMENRGRVLNRDQLLELAHDHGWDRFDRSIDIRISRLRRKIEADPDEPVLIRTVRGLGYIFDPPAT